MTSESGQRGELSPNSESAYRTSSSGWRAEAGWTVGLAAALLAVFLSTLLPDVGYWGDTAKFQYAGRHLGVVHAPGNPTYLLLSHVFTRWFPWGSLAYRADLFSALCTVAASVLVLRILRRLGVSMLAAWAAAFAAGLSRRVWIHAIAAEVYALHLLFLAAVFLALLRWRQEGRNRDFLLACALYAFSFGNHLIAIAVLPGFAWFTWVTRPKVLWNPRIVAWVAPFVVLGAAQYGYVLARTLDPSTPYIEVEARNLGQLWQIMRGGSFQSSMFGVPIAQVLLERVPEFFERWSRELLWLPVPFILVGWWRMERAFAVCLFLALAGTVLWGASYDVSDYRVYYIPAYFFSAIPFAVGMDTLRERWLRTRNPSEAATRRRPLRIRPLLLGGLAAYLAALLYTGYDQVRRNVLEHETRREAEQMRSVLETIGRDALVISPAYHYAQYLWYHTIGLRWQDRDLYVVHHFSADDVRAYLENGAPLYLPERRRNAPFGLAVYGLAPEHREQLEAAGLVITAGPDTLGLYRVRPAARDR